ncbi:MAG: CehA/McbA family metallohydrolase, partial [Gemmatimonadetes bacterium]|nr:CehA/McbA family metallohydrolase [Gemmatimonadota bacterium]
PDGQALAFVRDDSRTLAIVVRDLASGQEREIDRGMAMDPSFTPDGTALLYTNLQAGSDLDLWRADRRTGARQHVTTDPGLELSPRPHPDGQRILYMSKTRAGGDQVRLRTIAGGTEQTLLAGQIVSHARAALSPDGQYIAFHWPGASGWELRLLSLDRPSSSVLLYTRARSRPLAPAWSADGRWVYFSEGDRAQRLRLYRVAAHGGAPEEVIVRRWDYGVPMGRLVIQTGGPARLHVTDHTGHPLIPDEGMARFDGQNGLVYVHSPGSMVLDVPAGTVRVRATRGLATPVRETNTMVPAGRRVTTSVTLTPLWNAAAHGWVSSDLHFHLNYGGYFDLLPRDLTLGLRAEDVDVATPLLANLHHRYEDQELWASRSAPRTSPLVVFGQEVRSHFLGHVGLLGTRDLFWPWTWGPGYDAYGRDDRSNAEPLAAARAQGGLSAYVHPVDVNDPFTTEGLAAPPLNLIPDAVHGRVDLLEIVGLWNNSVGTTELWYRLLNAGLDVMPSGGTDMMADLHRTMAVGTARVYVHPRGPLSWASYQAALKAGRSFVTTGPLLDLRVQGARPGDVLPVAARAEVSLGVHSALPVDSIAIVVNGVTVASAPAPAAPFSTTIRRTIPLPPGGWVAARVVGGTVDRWPAMADRTFAHTAPIWIGQRLSTDPAARRDAVADLLRALAVAEARLDVGYAGARIPGLKAEFTAARERLQAISR